MLIDGFKSVQRPLISMLIKLNSEFIQPGCSKWPIFLDMSYTYMSESWPDKVKDKSEELFKREYDELLRRRFDQGGRGLFLYFEKTKPIGLSNVYISEENLEKVLNIAEFYVSPPYRRRGFAKQMKDHLVSWGKEHSATQLKIEVDKNLEKSNLFWSSFGYALDDSGSRNIYYEQI